MNEVTTSDVPVFDFAPPSAMCSIERACHWIHVEASLLTAAAAIESFSLPMGNKEGAHSLQSACF